MDQEAPDGVTRRGSRRWLRRVLVLLVALPPALFGLSNLALATPWARNWISGKITLRTSLETSIEGASWSPWNGVTFRGVTMLQPEPLRSHMDEPLIRISRLRMRPVWKTFLSGDPDIRDISLVSPRVVLPLEIVSYLASASTPPVAMHPPADAGPGPIPPVAPDVLLAGGPTPGHAPDSSPPQSPDANPPAPHIPSAPTTAPAHPPEAPSAVQETPVNPPPSAAVPPANPTPTPQPSPPPATAPPASHPAPAATPEKPRPPIAAPALSFPTDFVQVEDASFALVLASMKTSILEGASISGKIPIAGDPGSSSLTLGSIKALGASILEKTAINFHWKSPVISITPLELDNGGFKTHTTCQLGMMPGIPVALTVDAPRQSIEPLEIPGNATLRADGATGRFIFRGQLLFPSTWQADFTTAADGIAVTADGQTNRFDMAHTFIALRGGSLSCVDARIVGDHLSLLGNGTILSNGSTAGVLRVVAPPETTTSLVRRFFPGLQAPPAFSSMSTPQRVALDIEAAGTLGDIQLRLGKNGPLVGTPQPPSPVTPP